MKACSSFSLPLSFHLKTKKKWSKIKCLYTYTLSVMPCFINAVLEILSKVWNIISSIERTCVKSRTSTFFQNKVVRCFSFRCCTHNANKSSWQTLLFREIRKLNVNASERECHEESVNESVSTLFSKVLHVDDLASQSIAIHFLCVSVWSWLYTV